jgi:hypothetical protein
MVCAFEVLEHIEDDYAALVEWGALVEPGGWVLLSVPADPDMFGPHDEVAGHFRRYAREGLEAVLTKAGYDVVRIEETGAGMGWILQKLRDRLITSTDDNARDRTAASGHRTQPVRRWLAPAFYAAALPGRAMQYPFRNGDTGLGLVALARYRAA